MKTILVMTDFSPRAEHAAEVALQIAEKSGSNLLLYNLFFVPAVIPAETGVYPYYEEYSIVEKDVATNLERTAQVLKSKVKSSEDKSVEISIAHRPFALGEDIFESFDRNQIWLIVMGDKSRQGAISEFILGSLTTDVIERAFCPVLLVPDEVSWSENFKIAFASNLEDSDHKALVRIGEFAHVFNAEVIVIHVCKEEIPETERLKHIQAFTRIAGSIHYVATSYEEIEGDKVAETLAEFTRLANVQILAMVHNRYSFFKRLFHSSTTRDMLNYHQAMLMVLPNESRKY